MKKYTVLFLMMNIWLSSTMKALLIDRKPVSLKMFAALSIANNKIPHKKGILPIEMEEYVNLLESSQNSQSNLTDVINKSVIQKTRHFKDLLLFFNAKPKKIKRLELLSKKLLRTAVLFNNSYVVDYLLKRTVDSNMQCDKKGSTALLYAASNPNDHGCAELLLRYGASSSSSDSEAVTCLMLAAMANRTELMKRFVQNGVDINTCVQSGDDRGITALTMAVKSDARDAIKLLLELGADANKQEHEGEFPLVVALKRNDGEVVRQLIEHGADVTKEHPYYGGLCLYAINNGAIADYLLHKGADINKADGAGNTFLHHAVYREDTAMIDWLINKKALINQQNCCGDTPLHKAICRRNKKIIKKLLDAGADPHIKRFAGATCWSWTVLCGHTEIAESILNKSLEGIIKDQQELLLLGSLDWVGPEINSYCIDLVKNILLHKDYIPLRKKLGLFTDTIKRLMAIFANNCREVKECLKNGMDVNAPIEAGSELTPLIIACSAQSENVIRLLKSRGACVNAYTKTGESPLAHAVYTNNPKVIRLLLHLGADINEREKEVGERLICRAIKYRLDAACDELFNHDRLTINVKRYGTELRYAIEYQNKKMIERFLNDKRLLRPYCIEDFFQTIRCGDIESAEKMIEYINISDKEKYSGDTALMEAVDKDDERFVSLLLKYGADQNIRNFGEEKETAFLRACRGNKVRAIKVLLGHDTQQINTISEKGNTPLMYAIRNNNLELLTFLLNNRANPFIEDNGGRTALMHAYLEGKHEMIEILKNAMINY